MLRFVEYENESVITVVDELGDSVGNLIVRNGKYDLNLQYLTNNTNHLRQIADKLDELNK